MLSRIARAALLPAVAGLLLSASPAWAGGIQGPPVQCSGQACTITVAAPGSPGATGGSGGSGTGGGGGSGTGTGSSPQPTGTSVPVVCTYQPDPGYAPPASDTADQHPGQPGAWYLKTCQLPIFSAGKSATTTSVVWLASPPAATLPAPATLAALAQSRLNLASPVIDSNPAPGRPQLAFVPMWAWIPAALFAPSSASASVPGESVTATATPVSVTWEFGDGASMTCAGPGTAYAAGSDPAAASPTCGHTYARSSGNGKFTVTATITWNVAWAGGGQSGSFNSMTTRAAEQVRVEQSQALVTGG